MWFNAPDDTVAKELSLIQMEFDNLKILSILSKKKSVIRPMSLTCIVCKSMEHIIYSQIMNHLDNHNILVEFQHGFRANHSCETQLLNTVEDLSRRLDRRKATDLLILDFSKAFDTVPHRRLLQKLQHYGVTGRTNDWIKSWLCYRQQRVDLDGSASSDSPVSSQVCHRVQSSDP